MEFAILKLHEERSKLIEGLAKEKLFFSRKRTFESERNVLRIEKEIEELMEAIVVLETKTRIKKHMKYT